jgi:hypothetical protein
MRKSLMCVLVLGYIAALSSCGGSSTASGGASGGSPSSSTVAASPTPTASSSPTESTGSTQTEPGPSDDPGSSGPPIITAETSAPRRLVLADLFRADNWEEGSFQVAQQGQAAQQAIAATLTCSNTTEGPSVELRFAQTSATLHIEVAQALDSESSEDTVEFSVLTDNRRVNTKNIGFKDVAKFDVPLTGVSAVQIQTRMIQQPNSSCRGSAHALITDLSTQ